MYVLDSDAIQASAAIVATGEDLVLVLRHGLLSNADFSVLQSVLAPITARLSPKIRDVMRDTG